MVDRKNQHYVPQFYLDAWAVDKKVSTLVLEIRKTFNQSRTEVCARNYLYGGPAVEAELADLEGYHSWPIKELQRDSSLIDFSDTYLKLLYSFITTQRFRTKSVKSDIESAEEFLKEGVKKDLDNAKWENKIEWETEMTDEEKKKQLVDGHLIGIHHQLLVRAIFGFIGLSDLEAVILRNVTDKEFVVSDAPVVHDNPRFKQIRGPGTIGLGNQGLQIFCPLGPSQILLLYDPWIYNFNYNSKRQVLVDDSEVIDELNLLQYHNADSIIMFRDCNKEYIFGLLERMDEARQREKRTEELDTENGLSFEQEYAPHQQAPSISPRLPDYTVYSNTSFKNRRSSSNIERQIQVSNKVLQKAVFSDVSVIYAIRLLQELLDLERYET